MRATQLAVVALQAEKLRLQRRFQSVLGRVGAFLFAMLFLLFALMFAHVAGYDALRMQMPAYGAALVVFGVDLVFMIILLLVARKTRPDSVEQDARQLRDDTWHQLRNSLALTAAVKPLARILGRKKAAGLGLVALAVQQFLAARRGSA